MSSTKILEIKLQEAGELASLLVVS